MLFDVSFWYGLGWTTVTSIVTSSLVAALLPVVIKGRFDDRLARRVKQMEAENNTSLERLKADLAAENARDLERTRGDALREAERFRKWHGLLADRQAETIEKLYGLLADTHTCLLQCLNIATFGGEQDDVVLMQAFHTARWDALIYFRQKRLFLPPALSIDIEELMTSMVGSGMVYNFTVMGREKKAHDWDEQLKLWNEANGPMKVTLHNIEAKFQLLLKGETI